MIKKELIVEKDKKIVSLLQDFGFSFVDVNKMLRNKDVRVDNIVTKQNVVVKAGQKLAFFYNDKMLEKKYETVFEDEDVLIVYKSAGIETDGENGLSNHLNVFAVHRLDRNTEGLVIFAKNDKTKQKLEKSFKNHKIHKFYIAEVVGKFDTNKRYDAYLLKDAQKAKVEILEDAKKGSQRISMNVRTLKSGEESSLLEIELFTGKTHQIRSHLAFLGHQIIGDGKYGKNEINKKFKQNRQKLACFCLKFDFVEIEGVNHKEFKKFPKWMPGFAENSEKMGKMKC